MRQHIKFLLVYNIIFLVFGLLHVALYGVMFTDSIMLLIYSGVGIIWGGSIAWRVTDARVRNIIIAMVVFIELFFLMQLCNYKFFSKDITLERYSWYAYYVPMLMISCLLLFLAICLNRPRSKKLPPVCYIPMILTLIIVIAILTNDLHFGAFAFEDAVMSPSSKKSYGPVYFTYVVADVLFVIIAFCIMLWKCRVTVTKRLSWIPMVPLVIGTVYLGLDLFGISIRINDIRFWNMGESYFFMTIGFLESCIRIGLIPANSDYRSIFSDMKMKVRIYNSEGDVCYSSGVVNDEEDFAESVSYHIERATIPGGTVAWAVGVKEINLLDAKIREITEQIKTRNEYLRIENELKEEHTALVARNELYDNIASLLRPQLNQINLLLKEAREGDFTEKLKIISVLNAYIKRRSNMELLISDSNILTTEELSLAVSESLKYLELCGVETMLTSAVNQELPAAIVYSTYEYFESIVEDTVGYLKALTVTIRCEGDTLSFRFMLSGKLDNCRIKEFDKEIPAGYTYCTEVDNEGEDIFVALRIERGGEVL